MRWPWSREVRERAAMAWKATDPDAEPIPPQGVRMIRVDGTEIPLECVYVGEEYGVHTWRAVLEGVPMGREDIIKIDLLPPKTRISTRVSPIDG